MKIINLVENEPGDSGCEAAHGPSSFQSDERNHGRPVELCSLRG